MPTFKVTAPDGTSYNVTAPAGATQAQIMQRAQQHHAAATAPTSLGVADIAGAVTHGLIGSWQDEINGAYGAGRNIVRHFTNGEPLAPGKAFDRYQALGAARAQAVARDHPIATTLARGTGMAGSLFFPEAKVAKGATLAARMVNGAATAGTYGAIEGAGHGDGAAERLRNAAAGGVAGAGFGAVAPVAFRAAGQLAQQARLRVPGADRALGAVSDGYQALANAGRSVAGRPVMPIAPPSTRAAPQANRVLAEAIAKGPIRNGPIAGAPMATPDAVAHEVERRAALGVPAMVGDVTEPLAQATGLASRGTGPGQQMVRAAINDRKALEANRLRQHITGTFGPTVDPIAQMEVHTANAKANAAPGYAAAYDQPMVITPEIQQIMATPAFRDAAPQAVRNIENAMRDPQAMGFKMGDDGNLKHVHDLSTEGFDQVVRAMRDSGRAAADVNPLTGQVFHNTNSVNINARASELQGHIAAQNPAYADVTRNYADEMTQRDALRQGQDMPTLTGHEINAQARALPDGAHGAWAIGARSALGDEASRFAIAQPSGDGAGHLRAMLGDGVKQDALGQITGSPDAVQGLQARLDAEQQAHGVWQEAQRNASATRRGTIDGLNGSMGSNGVGPLTVRGKLLRTAGDILDKAQPQYAKDVRDQVGQVLTAQDPATVRAAMDAVTAQGDRQAEHDAIIANVLRKTSKAFGVQVVGNSGDETGMYGPTDGLDVHVTDDGTGYAPGESLSR